MDAGRCSVFISYKRANGGGRAHHIAADLKHHNIDVFIDTENPEPGRFEGRILNEISRCSHFLVVLNELVVSSFSDENEWVRKEVLYARSQGRTIVPVFDAGFDSRQLAESPLPFLVEYQGIHIHTDCVGDDLIRLRTLITGEERGAASSAPTVPPYEIDRDEQKKIIGQSVSYRKSSLICMYGGPDEGHMAMATYCNQYVRHQSANSYQKMILEWPPKSDPDSQVNRLKEDIYKSYCKQNRRKYFEGDEKQLHSLLLDCQKQLAVNHIIFPQHHLNMDVLKNYLDYLWKPVIQKGKMNPVLLFSVYLPDDNGLWARLLPFATMGTARKRVKQMVDLLKNFSDEYGCSHVCLPELRPLTMDELEHECVRIHNDDRARAQERSALIFSMTKGHFDPAVRELTRAF